MLLELPGRTLKESAFAWCLKTKWGQCRMLKYQLL